MIHYNDKATSIVIPYTDPYYGSVNARHTIERPECKNDHCICHRGERERAMEGDTGRLGRIEREQHGWPWR